MSVYGKEMQRLGVSEEVWARGERVLSALAGRFAAIDALAEENQLKVLNAFRKNRVSAEHMNGSTGYGYDDAGRDTLERVYADIFGTEDALVRYQITCGTHAITLALASQLRPGDELVSACGKPYDTLEKTIGIRPAEGSLAEYGVSYRQVELREDGHMDIPAVRAAITPAARMVLIQRSRGYDRRPSFSVGEIREVIRAVKAAKEDVIVLVDNCYGEFVEGEEPSEAGADIVAGSLIKNPGGGLAPAGGYLCGTEACIRRAAARLTAPGLGREVGASPGTNRAFYQGLFMAPVVTAAAEKGAIFAACLYESQGFSVYPPGGEKRTDIIQAVTLGSEAYMRAFCEGIQAAAPVDSYAAPVPGSMPGYADPVIMAAGDFVQGSSIELSADGPVRPPYRVYFQGGLTWPHVKAGILLSLQKLVDAGFCLC